MAPTLSIASRLALSGPLAADPATRDARLEAWAEEDVWEGEVRDTLVAGESAWRLSRWTYDHIAAEVAIIHFARHLATYERIASSFRFLGP